MGIDLYGCRKAETRRTDLKNPVCVVSECTRLFTGPEGDCKTLRWDPQIRNKLNRIP